ncbi:DinB family protein [Anseongella ginsenosidimutans]|uniref:DinB family protein n=1 Tax=Anseongella ginsenosidimutans TaxID=496056 RepID=A0A4R3KRN7_9SPHI|nr:DinB family protein [Anseongella ginsenosidimutans]QEC53070.1 DinB family protein [Anseongella ginsenosidimutans]TCS87684.1 DinB family protein [Anseongella ginsenosidimutans]
MNRKIESIKKFRLFLLKQIEDLTIPQLNEIPAGYNNNIIWNLGHLICAEQTMCYTRAGLAVTVEEKYLSPFMSGTKPERSLSEGEIKFIKEIFIASPDNLQIDFDNNIFQNYSPSAGIKKVYEIEVNNIDEALDYLLYHEGLHTGYVISLKKLLMGI